jgi:ubiquinone/menaquinone biosynthesis C-methylase UbiE
MLINNEIEKYYSENRNEPGRLERHPLEKMRTQQIIQRYLPAPPALVLDIGGGSGVYSFWLSSLGYRVHLVEPVQYHLEEARRLAAQSDCPLETIAAGDARCLEYADNTFDLVLMLGPLYHLVDKNDRVEALKEANRVVKKNGTVISAHISRFAALTDGFIKDLVRQPEFGLAIRRDLTTGCHTNPAGTKNWFTTAFFHRPEEIAPEIEQSGLLFEKLLPVESFGYTIPDIDSRLQDPSYSRLVLDSIQWVENEPSLLGISNHILGIGRKP